MNALWVSPTCGERHSLARVRFHRNAYFIYAYEIEKPEYVKVISDHPYFETSL
jgi:hypothetical protein